MYDTSLWEDREPGSNVWMDIKELNWWIAFLLVGGWLDLSGWAYCSSCIALQELEGVFLYGLVMHIKYFSFTSLSPPHTSYFTSTHNDITMKKRHFLTIYMFFLLAKKFKTFKIL